MEMFIDKYRPHSLDEFVFCPEAVKQLKAIAQNDNVPHMIIHGYPGSGKKTIANLYLRTKFGDDSIAIKSKIIELKCSSGTVDLLLLYSGYHYQINPSAHGVHDRLIFLNFIKVVAQYGSLNRTKYRVIIVENADQLTNEAQQALRRTLERYVSSCRFIFLVSNELALIDALQSRCIKVRLRTPTLPEIEEKLMQVAKLENYNYPQIIHQIVETCEHNYKHALHFLQLCITSKQTTFNLKNLDPSHTYLDKIVTHLFQGDNLYAVMDIRNTIYDLLTHLVDPVWIIKEVLRRVLSKISDRYFTTKHDLIKIANRGEHTLKLGSKPIYHLEGFMVSAFKAIKILQLKVQNSKGSKNNI